jgi:hypothetical protein
VKSELPALPEIRSVGAPPERHADRIIALMLQQIVQRHAELWAAVDKIMEDPHSS